MSKKKSRSSSRSAGSLFDQAMALVPKDVRKQVEKTAGQAMKQADKRYRERERAWASPAKQRQAEMDRLAKQAQVVRKQFEDLRKAAASATANAVRAASTAGAAPAARRPTAAKRPTSTAKRTSARKTTAARKAAPARKTGAATAATATRRSSAATRPP